MQRMLNYKQNKCYPEPPYTPPLPCEPHAPLQQCLVAIRLPAKLLPLPQTSQASTEGPSQTAASKTEAEQASGGRQQRLAEQQPP